MSCFNMKMQQWNFCSDSTNLWANLPMVPICSKKALLRKQCTSTISFFERIQSVALKRVLCNKKKFPVWSWQAFLPYPCPCLGWAFLRTLFSSVHVVYVSMYVLDTVWTRTRTWKNRLPRTSLPRIPRKDGDFERTLQITKF